MLHKILLGTLLCITAFVNAQILDTSSTYLFKQIEVYELPAEDLVYFSSDSTPLDTTLNLFFNYYPAFRGFPFLDLGLEGSAALPLVGLPAHEVGLSLGYTEMGLNFFLNDVTVHHTVRPFTRLEYSQGGNEFINVSVKHVQQISNRLTFGIDYRRIKNQNTYYSNIVNLDRVRMNSLFNSKLYVGYYSKDRKYELVASYLWNRNISAESGGIANDTLFSLLEGRQKIDNNEARYTAAFNTHAQNYFKVTQYYRPGGKSTDSTLDQSLGQFINQFYLTTELNNERIEYDDTRPDSSNYGKNLTTLRDSIHHTRISNELGYSLRLKPLLLSVGLKHAYDKVDMNGTIDQWQNIYALAKTRLTIQGMQIAGKAEIGLFGYNLGDYSLRGNARYRYKAIRIQAFINSSLTEPNYTERHFYSRALSWNTAFNKIAINELGGEAEYATKNQKITANVKLSTIGNAVYYSDERDINQESGLVSLLATQVKYAYTCKIIGADATGILQTTSDEDVIPRPLASAIGNVYGTLRFFKKNLELQVGMRGYWMSSFQAPLYNPHTRNWHNQDESFTVTSPINAYVMGKVKTFYFGLDFFHTQQGLMGNDYYASPRYPLMPRSLRLNFRWDLNN